jgi:hypothetical protein
MPTSIVLEAECISVTPNSDGFDQVTIQITDIGPGGSNANSKLNAGVTIVFYSANPSGYTAGTAVTATVS